MPALIDCKVIVALNSKVIKVYYDFSSPFRYLAVSSTLQYSTNQHPLISL